MKHLLATFMLCCISFVCLSQSIGIGTAAPASSAQLDITSTTKGILLPRMTTTARMAINSPAKGLLVYDSTAQQFQYYDGAIWRSLWPDNTGWKTGADVPDFSGNPPFGTVYTNPQRRLVHIASPPMQDHTLTTTGWKGGGLTVTDNGFGLADFLTFDGKSIEARRYSIGGIVSNNLGLNTYGGNVNIGRNTGGRARLEISGNVGSSVAMFGSDKCGVTISADNPEIGFNYFYNGGTKTIQAGYAAYMGMSPQNGNIYIGNFNGTTSTANFGSISGSSVRMYILQNGNVGIGTMNPTYKLSVNGNIRSKEVIVESGWADYVFQNDYKLPSLKETEQFILKHKHLPGIPSAKEIQENGLSVGELQTKMMAKIEELTLHVIALEKKIETLKNK